MRSVTTPSSSSASTNSYISFPKGSACLLDDQDWSYSSCANGATTAGAAAECAAAYSEANSGGGGGIGCFGQKEDPHSRPPPSHGPHRSSPNSLTALWNALRLKRANTRHENDAAAAAASSTAASGLGLSGSTLKPDGATSDVSRKSSFRLGKLSSSSGSGGHHYQGSLDASFSICKALLRKSVVVPRKLRQKSKSDNCLHRLDCGSSSNSSSTCGDNNPGPAASHHDLRCHHSTSNNRFTRRVFDLTNAISARVYPQQQQQQQPEGAGLGGGCQQQSKSFKPPLIKTRSLEKDFESRVHPPFSSRRLQWRSREENQRRTRSLERNHRYLVTLDATCRYSREVGSTQVTLEALPPAPQTSPPPTLRFDRVVNLSSLTSPREKTDLSERYQPDPTFHPPTGKPLQLPSPSSLPPRVVTTSRTGNSGRKNVIHKKTPPYSKESASFDDLTHVEVTECLVERALSAPVQRNNSHSKKAEKMPQINRSTTAGTMQQGSTASASFIVNKPARGWLHPDHLFAKDGINYAVRYIGCLEVNTSMKVLDFDTRSSIAKECINRVCESAGAKSVDRRRRVDRKVVSMLGERSNMDKAGANVQLTISSLWLKLSDLDTGQALFVHDMPNISFASGGDSDTLDFVAYVAKDRCGVRSCFVLECGGGLAQDVITTIGQAFELRFKEFLKRPPKGSTLISAASSSSGRHTQPRPTRPSGPGEDVEYYNDMPGKRPPQPTQTTTGVQVNGGVDRSKKDSSSSNLIDFNTELPTAGGGTRPRPPPITAAAHHDYVNGGAANIAGGGRDPFDMSPFATSPPSGGMQLIREEWFHGPISRRDAESLLQHDGDFLVRESQGSPGQYVLTGMQSNSKKHLLLVDPEGVVRTKDRTFDSVSHLIDYHRDNNLPIISAESAIRLKTPVVRMRK